SSSAAIASSSQATGPTPTSRWRRSRQRAASSRTPGCASRSRSQSRGARVARPERRPDMESAIRWIYGQFHVEPTHPWLVFVALLAIPAHLVARRSAGRVVFSSLRALPLGGQSWRTRLAWLPDALMACGVVALAIALTGPRAGDHSSRVRREGIAVMMAIDVSGSMRALDLSEH